MSDDLSGIACMSFVFIVMAILLISIDTIMYLDEESTYEMHNGAVVVTSSIDNGKGTVTLVYNGLDNSTDPPFAIVEDQHGEWAGRFYEGPITGEHVVTVERVDDLIIDVIYNGTHEKLEFS